MQWSADSDREMAQELKDEIMSPGRIERPGEKGGAMVSDQIP